MKYRIEYISTFHADILSTIEFLAEYPQKAARIFAKTDKALQPLDEWPEMYPVYSDVPTYRYIVIEDYLVLYRVKHQDQLVEIHRLLYGRMDIPAYITE